MRYYLVDDDPVVRAMLEEIIEDGDLGKVVGFSEDGSRIDAPLLSMQKVDVLLIDLLMPLRDGIETVRALTPFFEGKIIMISQVESKELFGEAYALGIEYYITKPINRLEVLSILRKVNERLWLEKSIQNVRESLNLLMHKKGQVQPEKDITQCGHFLLSELGMIGESGSRDLLEILEYLFQNGDDKFPPLKELMYQVVLKRVGPAAKIEKEIKAAEQRIRRAIYQALNQIASLGLTDYTNLKFENYAGKFFDFTEVRKKMRELEDGEELSPRINTKKFIQALYLEAKQQMEMG